MKLEQSVKEKISERLSYLYQVPADDLLRRLTNLIQKYGTIKPAPEFKKHYSHKDVYVITYGDSITSKERTPLQELHKFLKSNFSGLINNVHILPFFPFSSDDGFSVIDYRKVREDLGEWNDVTNMSRDFTVMSDLVINHVSSESSYFKNFLAGSGYGKDFFHLIDPDENVRMVTRPRSTPLLSPIQTNHGTYYLWTTFSPDQVDVNFSNPDVLFEFIDILLFYLSKGVRVIRLDAVAFLWKKKGTSCIHLEETHQVVKLIRDVVESVAPETILITETNVPHKENISYFGDGDEAHMVYNFSLPPLLYHAIITQNATYLTKWSRELTPPPEGCTYFNFASSHDGIGVRPLEGLVPDDEFQKVILAAQKRGGHVSYKENPDGSKSPYELNITYFDAFKDVEEGSLDIQIRKFICSQALMMSFRGVPAVYIHSLLGTQNDHEGVAKTGILRSINRRKWDAEEIYELLNNPESHHYKVFKAWKKLLKVRTTEPAFDPQGGKRVLETPESLFSMWRTSPEGSHRLLVVANVTSKPVEWNAPFRWNSATDLISGKRIGSTLLNLKPWQVCWIKY
ncbi:MAG: sugar phosphorylase [Balneolales bacterium]|nr:sugar phosphorylase [Balneolales bacterium]